MNLKAWNGIVHGIVLGVAEFVQENKGFKR